MPRQSVQEHCAGSVMTAEGAIGGSRDALTIPPWVPEPVAQAARTLHAHFPKSNNAKYDVVLKRVVADERMRNVWKQFSRRRRTHHKPTDVFLQSVDLLRIDSEAPQDHQDAAMTSLLNFAVNLAVDGPRVITPEKLETVRRRIRNDLEALRTAANAIRRHAPNEAAVAKVNGDLARNLEDQLSRMEASPLVVDRDTGDAQARCFCILFTRHCRQLFGSPLYGITAIVASVALGRNITQRAVREWCNSHPADKDH
jgi:hypothetical protein